MKTLKTILFTAVVGSFLTFGFSSCAEEEILPTKVEKSGGVASTTDDDAWGDGAN